jgi:hypothetical protein
MPKADAREEPKGWVKNEKPKLRGVGAPLFQGKQRALRSISLAEGGLRIAPG